VETIAEVDGAVACTEEAQGGNNVTVGKNKKKKNKKNKVSFLVVANTHFH